MKKNHKNFILKYTFKFISILFFTASYFSLLKNNKRQSVLYLLLSLMSFFAPDFIENTQTLYFILAGQIFATAIMNFADIMFFFKETFFELNSLTPSLTKKNKSKKTQKRINFEKKTMAQIHTKALKNATTPKEESIIEDTILDSYNLHD